MGLSGKIVCSQGNSPHQVMCSFRECPCIQSYKEKRRWGKVRNLIRSDVAELRSTATHQASPPDQQGGREGAQRMGPEMSQNLEIIGA